MDDYREVQRQRWLQRQGDVPGAGGPAPSSSSSAAAVAPRPPSSGAPATALAPAPSSSAGAGPTFSGAGAEAPLLTADGNQAARRIHILPVGRDPADDGFTRRLELLAPELKLKRDTKEFLKTGLYMRSGNYDFVVVKVDPEESVLAHETDYYVEGAPIQRLEKIQFICLWDFETGVLTEDASSLFTNYVSPYFKALRVPGKDQANIVSVGEVVKMNNLDFQVLETQPSNAEMGIVDSNTLVFVDLDTTPEFVKIHIVPFQDTLPSAYTFDVFSEYLKPYLKKNKHSRFRQNDQFTFQGVQFKVVCCEPEGPARIGTNTTIFCEGVLHPSLRNLLPPELLEQLSTLPPGLQMLLLNTEAFAGGYEERLMEVQDMLNRRRGLQNDTIERVEKFKWGDHQSLIGSDLAQTQCMVCLCDFEEAEEIRRLPCTHIYHASCIDEWLRRCTDCPICKANVDQGVRRNSRQSS